MQDTPFYKQAELLLQILPFFKSKNTFALKGGTAINFFYQDLPRLSVDIDLTYLPINDREESLADISDTLKQMAEVIEDKLAAIQVSYKYVPKSKTVSGLVFLRNNVSVKIEPNLVIRGSVYEPTENTLCKTAQDMFGINLSFLTLSKEDVYGGKICAALDRQHPRDLFDIKILLEDKGFNEKVRKAFIVYLISHSRPMVELLNPNLIDIEKTFENEFYGMTSRPVRLEELHHAREELMKIIRQDLSDQERRFILSIKMGKPVWDLFELAHPKHYPLLIGNCTI